MLESVLSAFALTEVRPDVYTSPEVEGAGGVAFGGLLLGQAIVAAQRSVPDKSVRTVHAIFARALMTTEPSEIQVERMHGGRNVASVTVSFVQSERVCARVMVLLGAQEADLIRHARPMPVLPAPDPANAVAREGAGPESIIVGNVDISDPALTGPPVLQLWVRFAGAKATEDVSRALLAYATDGWLIGTAMRPHSGFGQALAHKEFSTSVLSHSLSFFEPIDSDEWLLIEHESIHAGSGRAFGRADVFTEDGRLVASFSQDSMIRAFPGAQKDPGH